ncbi:hypothetical protein GTZ99_07815 [Novosphingobium sp. FSY-8]|uniref:Lipoprotein n=1 Tax=Novosphingobium ovatum TaxID=1908523 RepID=A0ABW9XD71_9SPHN|nr:hypothetical protein [Novosphingobium ovatum]NBC36459.1 hypothetical protein [Novosphingobium ovatum]
MTVISRLSLRHYAACGLLAVLGGCGSMTDLKPKPGHDLPPAPYGRVYRPGSGELLQQGTQLRPGRNVETHTRSESRNDDPYDLPPQD